MIATTIRNRLNQTSPPRKPTNLKKRINFMPLELPDNMNENWLDMAVLLSSHACIIGICLLVHISQQMETRLRLKAEMKTCPRYFTRTRFRFGTPLGLILLHERYLV